MLARTARTSLSALLRFRAECFFWQTHGLGACGDAPELARFNSPAVFVPRGGLRGKGHRAAAL
jgi:hypothetical protein